MVNAEAVRYKTKTTIDSKSRIDLGELGGQSMQKKKLMQLTRPYFGTPPLAALVYPILSQPP